MATSPKTDVVIIGTGIFGMSTALWMLRSGNYKVTLLDKSDVLPAPDAASTDINKIIRATDYADIELARLALDAVDHWRKPEWEGCYHESGVICLSTPAEEAGMEFVNAAYQNCLDTNTPAKLVDDVPAIKDVFGPLKTGSFGGRKGYHNTIGGWAEAGRAVEVGLKMVRQLGGTIRAGAEVVGLVKDGKRVEGVILKDGEKVLGDLVVAAAGAWTPKLFASPQVSGRLPDVLATGQSVGCIQLTPEETETYGKVPVIFNLDDGYYVFPPNGTGLMKMAIHGAGYLNPQDEVNGVSVPRTKLTPGAENGAIPKAMLEHLRKGLGEVYPDLAKKDYVMTRLCWYCDTVTGDWLIDYHPDYENLFLATGGSGHAFKFAPNIGREVLSVIERKPLSDLAKRWIFDIPKEAVDTDTEAEKGDVNTEAPEIASAGADVRAGMRKVLKEDDLVTAADLKG